MSDETQTDAAATPTARETADLVGHEAAEHALLAAYRSGRLPHAWMITGPRGIGKATLAYRFARFVLAGGIAGQTDLLGDAPTSLAIAEDDPVFRRVVSGGHADFLVIDRQMEDGKGGARTEIVVDDVRRIGRFLRLTAAEGGWRVVVVDDADDMNRNAANALLKVLEEPPANSLLLLVCHNPGRLPATIRSRCRRLALQPLDAADVDRLLASHAGDLSPGDRRILVSLAEGRPGRAIGLAAAGGRP
jgi:DNA polymerase-3 subunit delta'